MAWGDVFWEDGSPVVANWENGQPVKSVDGMGNDVNFYDTWGDNEGYRKPMFDAGGNEIPQYLPGGVQIPLFADEPEWYQLTNDEVHPDAPGVPEPEPEPEPGDGGDGDGDGGDDTPAPAPDLPGELTAARLKQFMAGDGLTDDQAEIALASATALVEGYTRGNHVDGNGDMRAGISTVILTVAARIAANPGQIVRRDQAGSFSQHRGVGFQGFTLAELAVLNRYRKRATG